MLDLSVNYFTSNISLFSLYLIKLLPFIYQFMFFFLNITHDRFFSIYLFIKCSTTTVWIGSTRSIILLLLFGHEFIYLFFSVGQFSASGSKLAMSASVLDPKILSLTLKFIFCGSLIRND